MRFCWLLALALPACAHFSYRSPGPYEGRSLLGGGSYLAETWLTPTGGEPVRFNALFTRPVGHPALLSAVAPSGKPFFRVLEAPAGPDPEVKLLSSELAVSADAVRAYCHALRPLLLLVDDGKTSPTVAERWPDARPRRIVPADGKGELRVDEYDWDGHAFRLSLSGEGFTATMTLRGYEITR